MKTDEKLSRKRHTLAHLLARAVLEYYPNAKPTIGPAIDDGFYYDFDFSPAGDADSRGLDADKQRSISEEDLPKIEATMKELLPSWTAFTHKEVSANEARAHFAGNPYKTELIDELEKNGETITFYMVGDFTDLCRGGHSENPEEEIKPDSFALSHIAGAYWRGSEKNKMLTRIYGLAFDTKRELDEYVLLRKEARKRDHRKIGQEQGLFFIDEMVGKGLIMWLPKGNTLKSEIETLALKTEKEAGYVRVTTPHIAKESLYLTSGHLPYYKDSMYPPMEMDDGVYYLRAMNCPHHHRIYTHTPKSYRDLPLRIAEYGTVYRNELSGTLAGLLRVRGLAMNDAHIYCGRDQIKDEFKAVMNMTMGYFTTFGLSDYWFRLSRWSGDKTEKYINEPENWEYSEKILKDVLDEMDVPYVEAPDEAAFYGPKVDVMFKSVIGREETMSTIQLDFLAKARFGLSYVDSDGNENGDVFVIHRAPLSTHERFLAFLIEHYGGKFPYWLSPVQVKVLPISEAHLKYARNVWDELNGRGVRSELDDGNETLGKKIRNWNIEKVPYALVIGEKEVEGNNVTVESRDGGKLGVMSIDEFLDFVSRG